MSEGTQRLRRVLSAEAGAGFANRAVYGGLDRLLRNLIAQGELRAGSPATAAVLTLPAGGYAALGPPERARWVRQLLAALDGAAASARTPRSSSVSRGHLAGRQGKAAEGDPTNPADALDQPVTLLRGVKAATAAKLERLGVRSIGDLLYHVPHRYNDFSRLVPIARAQPGAEQTVVGTVWSAAATQIGRRMRGTEAVVGDETGNLRVVWFNQGWIARQLRRGSRVVLAGKVTLYHGQLVMESPEWDLLDRERGPLHAGRLVPVYPTTAGLYQRSLRRLVSDAVERYADLAPETLPEPLRAERELPPLPWALHQLHLPDSQAHLQRARRRLALDELLAIQVGVLQRRACWRGGPPAPALMLPEETRRAFVASLPFALTAAQERALDDILADLARTAPMSRLLQGDVGSGKTVVATAALLAAVLSGRQGVIMAPTEILASQHHRTLAALLGSGDQEGTVATYHPPYLGRPVRVALLRGGLHAREKAQVREAVAAGQVEMAVGTHALIQEGVEFPRLGLAVVDEQHRFGVMQRTALRLKGESPHLLVMTATPIPRTLTLTVYGDLDVSVLDEMPPGRKPIRTTWALPEERGQAYQFVREQVRQERQAFVICPLIEESEAIQAKAAVQELERLEREVFPDLRLGLLHGRMPAREKETVMAAFRDRRLDILVSTAVVEVGIDVPNATVMMVEGADRFGLAQLHQLRGRVGRGAEQSYCLLLSDNPSEEARERLRIVESTQDGFTLAEEDLRLRGPGEYYGLRQAGMPDLKVARLTDTPLIEEARRLAERILASDPELSAPEHGPLRHQVEALEARTAVVYSPD